jgi:hypothetical protein
MEPLGIEFRDVVTLKAPLTVCAITPMGAAEVVAVLPDRSVKRLVWVREFRPEWNRSYVSRRPLRLPKGTKVWVYGQQWGCGRSGLWPAGYRFSLAAWK